MPKGSKKESRTDAEQKLQARYDALTEQGKKQKDGLTEAQKNERKMVASGLRAVKFVRIANKRIPRTLASIAGIGALGSYAPTEAQRKAIGEALDSAVSTAKEKLGGKKDSVAGFSLPTT